MSLITIRPRSHSAHSSQTPEFSRRARFRRPCVGVVAWPTTGSVPASAYLRRWVTHQAETYTSLLLTIAAAPRPEGSRVSVSEQASRSPDK
jgi:hypothetical protein